MQPMTYKTARLIQRVILVAFVALGAAGTYLACSGQPQPQGEPGTAHALGGQVNPPGLGRVVTSGGILAGSGTSSNPLTATISTSGIVSGTGSAGSPLTSSISVSSPVSGTGSAGSPLTASMSTISPLSGTGSAGSPLTAAMSVDSPITGTGTSASHLAIATNGISNTLLRQSAGVSVIGRSANSTGNVADITASADGQVLTRSSGALAWTDPATIVPGIVPYMGVFGTGVDGSLHFDGTSTITVNGTAFAPDVNKRYLITRDLLCTDLVIDTGAVLIFSLVDNEKASSGSQHAFRLFGTGTLTLNGQIRNAGNGAQALTLTGHGAVNGAGASAGVTNQTVNLGTGGAGSGTAGGAAAAVMTNHYWFTQTATTGGATNTAGTNAIGFHLGGGGGGSATFAGGAGAGGTILPVANSTTFDIKSLLTSLTIVNATASFAGTGGGGGAWGSVGSQPGGNGGGGGGVIVVSFKNITGSGSFAVPGGDGSNGGTNAGGGGGGGGGVVVIQTITTTASLPSRNLAGGNGGTGNVTGKNGGNGSSGKEWIFNN